MRAVLAVIGVTSGALVAVESIMAPTPTDRVTFILIFTGAGLLVLPAARSLRGRLRRIGSLRRSVIVVSLASVAIVVAVVAAASLVMFLSPHDLRVVLIAALIGTALSIILATTMTDDLRRDLDDLQSVVRRVGRGDLTTGTASSRADELGDLWRAFDEMTARLSSETMARHQAEAARRSFLAALSHDLRTPLTSMRVAVEALEDGLVPDPARYLRALGRDVEALSKLVDDLFLLSRIEAGRLAMRFDEVDVAELADEAIEAMQPVADRGRVGMRLHRSGSTVVIGGSAELGRVVRNLLDNAIRYAPPGTGVDISIRRSNGSVRLSVSDRGPGFPAHFRDVALEDFTRADTSRSRSHGGAGLGLAIARGLVTAHGGSLRVGRGVGAVVTVVLPITGPETQPDESDLSGPQPLASSYRRTR